MIEIRLCASDADKEASLAIYNAVWPWNAVTMDEVRSFRAQMTHYADFLAPAAGLVAAAITPWRPEVALMFLTVLPEQRARGVGTALYREASSWIAQHGVEMMDAPAPEDDLSSIAFAERHGFQEITRSPKLILDEARPDRLGAGTRLRTTDRVARAAKRAEPADERAPRLPGRAGESDYARAARRLGVKRRVTPSASRRPCGRRSW